MVKLGHRPVAGCIKPLRSSLTLLVAELKRTQQTFIGMRMEPYQWFLLGIMAAFTPSLLVLGVLLARSAHPTDSHNRND
jgi:hypothetical protein